MADPISNWLAPPTTTEFVQDAVTHGIELNQDFMVGSISNLTGLTNEINALINQANAIANATATMGEVTTVVDDFALPTIPVKPDISGAYDGIVIPSGVDTSGYFQQVAPTRPNLDGYFDAVVAPERPLMPAFPIMGNLLAVNPNFAIQQEYLSTLIDQLRATLYDMVIGLTETGLTPQVEQQIWDRGRERTRAATQGLVDNVNRAWARAGWDMPQGAQVESVNKALETQAVQDITESRSIAVAQADLNQKNRQFSIIQGIALETLMSGIWDAMQKRVIETEKARIDSLIETNKQTVEVFSSGVTATASQTGALSDMYKADAQVLDIMIRADTAQVGAITSLYETDAKVMSTEVQADTAQIGALVDVYKSELSLVHEQVAQATAEVSSVTDMYKTDGSVYNSIASAQADRMKAQTAEYSAEVDYLSKKVDTDIEIIKANIATFMSQKELSLGALKALAQIWSQISASFGSAVNYSAGISASESNGFSQSNSSSFTQSISDSTTHSA